MARPINSPGVSTPSEKVVCECKSKINVHPAL
jgi:hypothetical protein